MPEPERVVLDLEAERVALVGVVERATVSADATGRRGRAADSRRWRADRSREARARPGSVRTGLRRASMYHLDRARRLHRPLAGAAHHTSAAALGLDRRGVGTARAARGLVALCAARAPPLARRGPRHRRSSTRSGSCCSTACAQLVAGAHGITTDGVTYFAQLRSVVVDGDLDVTREFAHLGQPPRPNHVVPIGPTLIWTPLYLVVTARAMPSAARSDAWRGAGGSHDAGPRAALRARRAAVVVCGGRGRPVGVAVASAPALRASRRRAPPWCCSSAPRRSSGTWSTSRR